MKNESIHHTIVEILPWVIARSISCFFVFYFLGDMLGTISLIIAPKCVLKYSKTVDLESFSIEERMKSNIEPMLYTFFTLHQNVISRNYSCYTS